MFECVELGIDTFDCVAPTRLARHGGLYTASGRLNIARAEYREDHRPIERGCACFACQNFSRAYLRHLFAADEILGYRLATVHNLHFILMLMATIRRSIADGTFGEVKQWVPWRKSTSGPVTSRVIGDYRHSIVATVCNINAVSRRVHSYTVGLHTEAERVYSNRHCRNKRVHHLVDN